MRGGCGWETRSFMNDIIKMLSVDSVPLLQPFHTKPCVTVAEEKYELRTAILSACRAWGAESGGCKRGDVAQRPPSRS